MYKNKKILAVITARGGSKGVPHKNIKKLGGKPLIFYTIKSANKSRLIDKLILSSDDKEIIKICEKYKVEIPFVRPAKLATDKATSADTVRHALKFMENTDKCIYDYIVILQPTSPFRLPEDIDNLIKLVINKNADSGVSLSEITSNHPLRAKKIVNGRVLDYCLKEKLFRRQDLPVAYKRDGIAYVLSRNVLNKKYFFGNFVVGYIIPSYRSVDINNEFDWAIAEYMYKKFKRQEFFSY